MNAITNKLASYSKGMGNTVELSKVISAEFQEETLRVSFGAYAHNLPCDMVAARFIMDVCKEHKLSKKDVWDFETMHKEFDILEAGFLCEKHKSQTGQESETPVVSMKDSITARQYKEFLIRKNKDSGITAYWTLSELLEKPEKEVTKAILLGAIKDIIENWIVDDKDMENLKALQDKEEAALLALKDLKEIGFEKIILSSIPDHYKGLVVAEKAKDIAQVLPTKGFVIVSTGFDMDTMKVSIAFKKVKDDVAATTNL